ncbi:MAG: hypothetical protein ACR2K6_06150 [Solirubrobacterales bacterium]
MIGALFNVLAAVLILVGVARFFIGFVLAPLLVLAVGYVVLQFAGPGN